LRFGYVSVFTSDFGAGASRLKEARLVKTVVLLDNCGGHLGSPSISARCSAA
jgi:hypothetical protein